MRISSLRYHHDKGQLRELNVHFHEVREPEKTGTIRLLEGVVGSGLQVSRHGDADIYQHRQRRRLLQLSDGYWVEYRLERDKQYYKAFLHCELPHPKLLDIMQGVQEMGPILEPQARLKLRTLTDMYPAIRVR